jgi:hypothetical protein
MRTSLHEQQQRLEGALVVTIVTACGMEGERGGPCEMHGTGVKNA